MTKALPPSPGTAPKSLPWSDPSIPQFHKFDLSSFIRYIGTSLMIIGHFTLLWGDPQPALQMKLLGAFAVLPFALKWRLWDVVVLEAIFIFLDGSKLLQLIFS